MFLTNCGGTGGDGGGGTITNNVYITNNYVNLPMNVAQFVNYPVVSDHFRITSTQPITASGGTITSTGLITFTFHEDSVFVSATLGAMMGASTMTFRTAGGTVIKTVAWTSTVATDNIIFRSVDIHLDMNSTLSQFVWQTPDIYTNRTFTDAAGTTILELYPITVMGATATGTMIVPTGAAITVAFASPTVIYNLTYGGTVQLYRGGSLVYTAGGGSGGAGSLGYPNPIDRMVVDQSITSMDYLALSDPSTILALGATTVSATMESAYWTWAPGNVLTFAEPTFVTNIIQSAPGTIIINGITYTGAPSTISKRALVSSISGANLVSMDCAIRERHEAWRGPFTTMAFNQFHAGAIIIETDYYRITSSDQVNHPAMVTGAGAVIWSTDGSSLTPTAGAGTITIAFKQYTWLQSLQFSGGSTGTVAINGHQWPILGTTLSLHDWVNQSSIGCMTVAITWTNGGSLVNMNIMAVAPDTAERDNANYIVEDFERATVEFVVTTYDTNVATALGTPNTAFGGPGVGAGGGPGNGVNATYLGRATQDNITFDQSRWVQSIVVINALQGYRLTYYDNNAAVIDAPYVGNYGANSVVTVPVMKFIRSITITGNMAIASITYSATPREVIGLVDTSMAAVTTTSTASSGNYILTIASVATHGATAIVLATKSAPSVTATMMVQNNAAPTAESITATWPTGTAIQLNHATTRSGGTGATLWYVMRIVNV